MYTRIGVLIIVLIFFQKIISQESTIPLTGRYDTETSNPYKKHYSKNFKQPIDSFFKKLPFFDDFTTENNYPDTTFWKQSSVFINNSFAKGQPSYGVATLDALDNNGELYQKSSQNSFNADSIVSKYIDLSQLDSSKGVFLSFFYQSGGLGDPSETNDSLILDFWDPLLKNWDKTWFANKTKTDSFSYQLIQIKDKKYFNKRFRFRFRNVASIISPNEDNSYASNRDIWNIDYIYLNSNRSINDTTFLDLAIQDVSGPFLVNYSSIPWNHALQPNSVSEYSGQIGVFVKNNFNDQLKCEKAYEIVETLTNREYSLIENDNEISQVILGSGESGYFSDIRTEPSDYTTLREDKAIFQITTFLRSENINEENTLFRANNSMKYNLELDNFYAYDDGSSELGYGIRNNGDNTSSVAIRFSMIKPDTLQAVQIFFNRTLSTEYKNFKLMIWNVENNLPGKIIDSLIDQSRSHAEGVNQFKNYIWEKPVALPKDFFIGWVQNSPQFMNIGFDVNRKMPSNRVYYKTANNWTPSTLKGCIMFRPIVGSRERALKMQIKQTFQQAFTIYPNPFEQELNIKYTGNDHLVINFELFNIFGFKVLEKELILYQKNTLQVPNLTKGIYIYRIYTGSNIVETGKLIKK